uniref:Uncharacterized protein n=1 Tax=Kalanchoe fedtschenkoi TaxID=63787 RepID=A0A7N0RHL9_KALFE
MTIRAAIRNFKSAWRVGEHVIYPRTPLLSTSSPPFKSLHVAHVRDVIDGSKPNPVAVQMINYALSHARSQKSDESYAQGLLILEQCLSSQTSDADETSKGMVLLAMSSLLFERGNFDDATEKLKRIGELPNSALGVQVAAMEALVGLNLEMGLDDTSSRLADRGLQLLDSIDKGHASDVLGARIKAIKGLAELAVGNVDSAESFFPGVGTEKCCAGNVALSYGELLHVTRKFELAKEIYQEVIQGLSSSKDSEDACPLAACNMSPEHVLSAATCGLGQVEAHLGNFADAEEILTQALTKTEENFGLHHPRVGVILTCIALMFRQKSTMEHSSALLVQEGLYRRAIELLKAPPLDTEGAQTWTMRRDIIALARGGYAEVLNVQQNRKDEGERMKKWAEGAWRNRRLSLAEALEVSETSNKVPVVDARIIRVL